MIKVHKNLDELKKVDEEKRNQFKKEIEDKIKSSS